MQATDPEPSARRGGGCGPCRYPLSARYTRAAEALPTSQADPSHNILFIEGESTPKIGVRVITEYSDYAVITAITL